MKITRMVPVLFAALAAVLAFVTGAYAQQPIKVGIGIAQTGPLGGGGEPDFSLPADERTGPEIGRAHV